MFKYLANKAAFIDRIELSVWTDQKPIRGQLVDEKSFGILSPKCRYSRCLSGKTPLTGNPVQVIYGKKSQLPRVPPCQVKMWSETVPLTGAQVNEAMRLLLPSTSRIQPVLTELTFDFQRVSVNQLYRQIVHRARIWYEIASDWRKPTIYMGSPTSAWQLKIYNKADGVTRLELTLRQKLLAGYGITQPDSVINLRSIDLEPMFSFRRFSSPRIVAATTKWEPYLRDAARDWKYYRFPLHLLYRMMGARSKADDLFPSSRRQQTVTTMQANLIW